MIGYTSLGTNDLARASAFYDALLAEMGAQRCMEFDDFIVWMQDGGQSAFSIHIPHDGAAATVGNGVMIALNAGSREKVDALHAKALSLGGQDEGAPGPRGDSGFYAAYFRDLDGNKLNVHVMG